jgi:heptosyltransferase-2
VVAARPPIAPLFELVPGIDEIVVLAGRGDADRLRPHAFDAALLLPNSFQTALSLWRAGIPERWGYRTDYRSPLLTRAIVPPSGVHQGAYYQHLVRALGVPNGPLEPAIEVNEARRRAGTEMLASHGWDRRAPLAALAPGAAYGGAKRWPAESFAALARDLAGDGVMTVLVGSAADRPAGAEVVAALGGNTAYADLIGRTDLQALCGVLANCRTLVSNDSGAMHVGAALGLPVTAVFGPTRERATRPLGSAGHVVLTNPVWCRPCMLRECPLTHRCMKGIRVEAALSAARSAL